MGKLIRGKRDKTGPYKDSYAFKSGLGGRGARCYEGTKIKGKEVRPMDLDVDDAGKLIDKNYKKIDFSKDIKW